MPVPATILQILHNNNINYAVTPTEPSPMVDKTVCQVRSQLLADQHGWVQVLLPQKDMLDLELLAQELGRTLHPVAAAITAGLQAGVGILILIRHGASLGGVGVMAIYLQKTRGWRAGTVQMAFDSLILAVGLLAVEPHQVMLSVLGAAALNLVIGVNHRPDRYHGF